MATGRNSQTLIGQQTDKATKATDFTKLLVTSNSMLASVETMESEALTGNRFSIAEVVSKINGEGNTPVELTKEELKLLLPYAGFNPDGTELIFTAGNTIDEWATVIKDFVDEGYYEEFIGCKINTFDINIVKGGFITAEVGWLSLEDNHSTTAFAGTVTELVDRNTILKAFGTTLTLGGTDITALVDEFSLSINNNLDADDRGINDIYRRDLQAQGSEITYSITAKFDKTQLDTLKNNLKDGTTSSIVVSLSEGIDIDLHRISISDVTDSIDGPDKVTVSFNGRCFYDAVNGIVTFTFA